MYVCIGSISAMGLGGEISSSWPSMHCKIEWLRLIPLIGFVPDIVPTMYLMSCRNALRYYLQHEDSTVETQPSK